MRFLVLIRSVINTRHFNTITGVAINWYKQAINYKLLRLIFFNTISNHIKAKCKISLKSNKIIHFIHNSFMFSSKLLKF